MDVHVLTVHGAELVVQVLDGKVIVPESLVEIEAEPTPALPPPLAPG